MSCHTLAPARQGRNRSDLWLAYKYVYGFRGLLADSRGAGARTGAVEEAIQVAVCHPSSGRAPEHAQHYIEDRVGEGMVDASCGEEVIEQDLDALPARSSYESDHAARDQGVARRVEELVVAADPVR